MEYLCTIKEENDKFILSFQDFPNFVKEYDDLDTAHDNAFSSLIECIQERMRAGKPIPAPTPEGGRDPDVVEAIFCCLGIISVMKVNLWNISLKDNVKKSTLAALASIHPQEMSRVFDLKISTNAGRLEQMFNSIGYDLKLDVIKVNED